LTDGISYVESFLSESIEIASKLDRSAINAVVQILVNVKNNGGRIFFCGSGGGAGHSSHAACDFRKLAGIESYSVSDNVSELTARINDESWTTCYAEYLKVSRINQNDLVFIISVGGGDKIRQISTNLTSVMDLAREVGARIVGIVGRDGGYLAQIADSSIVVPQINSGNVTAQVEGFQALIWHMIVTHPALGSSTPKWESVV
jgi:D-sedoheptulose 7-phosphate isomerase